MTEPEPSVFSRSRSILHARSAAVATSHPQAALTALDILARGGNAVDAAIAGMAVLGVVEPHQTGIGGDCFALYMPRDRRIPLALNGSGRAPRAASCEQLRRLGLTEIGLESPHAVTIPGAVAGWIRLLGDHGTMALGTVLEPAIRMARDGVVLQPCIARDWAAAAHRLAGAAASVFLPGGKAPRAGALHRQPALAATLQRIATHGADGFYRGPVAEEFVTLLRSQGGLHCLEDFTAARADYVTPISAPYRGLEVFQVPPSGQGLAALMMLNILSGFDLSDPRWNEADRIHLLAEATNLTYHHRTALFADPDFAETPVAQLLSAEWAADARAAIDVRRTGTPALWPKIMHRDTVCLCVADGDGNAISMMNSLFHAFGSTILAPGSGVLLHNRGAQFSLDPAHPNCIEGGKRPLHTLAPAMVVRNGAWVAPFGMVGGPYQAVGHVALLSGILDRGFDLQQALDAPRSFAFRGVLSVEPARDSDLIAELRARGHDARWAGHPIGCGQIIWRDPETEVLAAASDSRADGCALGV